jgi:hypothetical protein
VVNEGNLDYSSDDGVLYNKNKTTLILCPPQKAGSYNIPDSVTDIKFRAFDTCKQLTSVTIPDGVTTIRDSTFFMCTGLKSVTLPSTVTLIENSAFFGTSQISDVYFNGSKAQWNAIEIKSLNTTLSRATIHYAIEE